MIAIDVGEPIREVEVIPEHVPVPVREPSQTPTPVTPKEKEVIKNDVHLHPSGVME